MSEPTRIYDATKLMQSVLEHLARRKAVEDCGVPLWSVVGHLTNYGSTSSWEICRQFGLDGGMMVRQPRFIDESKEVIKRFCPKHEVEFDLDDSCPEGCED